MASIIRRNKRRWKGVKWIDTPFAIPYKRRLAFASAAAGTQLACGYAKIKVISASTLIRDTDKLIALARAVVSTQKAAAVAFKNIMEKKEA